MINKSPLQSTRAVGLYALATLVLLALALAGCAGPAMRDEAPPVEARYSLPPHQHGVLADLAARQRSEHADFVSGFRLIDSSYDGLRFRLALIDSAVSSIDVMTYLWYPDASGTLLLERAVLAAERGVKVRLIVDDLLTIGQEALMANLEAQPNISLRLFNPWKNRSMGARAAEMIAEMERLNTRLHNKLLVVDGNAAIIGGRNLGDHYFGLSDSYNFHDLDIFGVGDVVQQSAAVFDAFWNSEWTASAAQLDVAADPEKAREQWRSIQEKTRTSTTLDAFPREPRDWSAELAELAEQLHHGRSIVVSDDASGTELEQTMIGSMFSFFELARKELLIVNAYVIPGQPAIEFLQRLNDDSVDVAILTNSLSSHDLPAVNGHYEPWRDDILRTGTRLYELRSDGDIKSIVDVPPVEGEFIGLHSKAAVVDRRYSFVGSMNLDPRSANLNTEMGVIVDSPGLAEDLARLILRDMQPENAWQVTLKEDETLLWTNSEEIRDSQPTRNALQNVMNVILKIVPVENF